MDPSVKRKFLGTPANSKRKSSEIHVSNSLSWIDNIINSNPTAEEQIPLIINQIEAGPDYYTDVDRVFKCLNYTIQSYYQNKNAYVRLFGSAATRLALKNSDCDAYLDFGGNLPETLENFAKSFLSQIRKNKYFFKPVLIYARVPIIHCVHASGIECDISFLNGLGVSNSNLIKFLINLDNRIRPLILILKFLFKRAGLIGTSALTSYAMTLLVIFFLQQLEKPFLPPICTIQEAAKLNTIEANWNTSFTTLPEFFPEAKSNTSSVTKLLKAFFEFYASFEFGFYVISLFTGKKHLKPMFSNPESLPSVFQCYKDNLENDLTIPFEFNKPMCVQGPFNHSHNVTRGVTEKTLQIFQALCLEKNNTCPEEFEPNKGKTNNSVYFKHLFRDLNEYSFKKMKITDRIVKIYVGCTLPQNPDSTEDELRNLWSEYVLQTVLDILTKVMKCKVITHNPENYSEDSSTVSDDKIFRIIDCEMPFPEIILKKRRTEAKHEFELPKAMSQIDQESMISDYLLDTVLMNIEKVSLKFVIKCVVKKGPTCFMMYLKGKKGESNLLEVEKVITFILINFPKWIK